MDRLVIPVIPPIILIWIIRKIFKTNPTSIYLSLSMRGNSDSPSELFQARSATFRGLAHIYEALTLLLGVSSQGFIGSGCQENCQAVSCERGSDLINFR